MYYLLLWGLLIGSGLICRRSVAVKRYGAAAAGAVCFVPTVLFFGKYVSGEKCCGLMLVHSAVCRDQFPFRKRG